MGSRFTSGTIGDRTILSPNARACTFCTASIVDASSVERPLLRLHVAPARAAHVALLWSFWRAGTVCASLCTSGATRWRASPVEIL